MSKIFAKCELCKAPKFVNHLGLCKRCSKNPASNKIRADFHQHELEDEKFEKEMKAHDSQDAKELHSLEEKEDLTSEEKERLMELKPELTSMADVEEYLKKLHAPKDVEPTKEEASEKKEE